jgi:4-amino-4-deoxy-L-arabinose transferase-like glycosyltransferase
MVAGSLTTSLSATQGTRRSSRPPRWVLPLAVGVVAMAVRAVFLLGIEAYPKFELIRNRLDDQVFFHGWALAVVRDQPLDLASSGHEFAYWAAARPGVFPQDPLYPWVLAAVYRALGFRFDLVRWIQAALGAVAAALTCALGQRLMRGLPAALAGLAVALHGPLVFYEAAFLREAPATALLAIVLFILDTALHPGGAPHRRARALVFAAGLGLGAAVLLRSNLLLFAIGAAAWAWRAAPRSRMALVLAAGAALPVLPVVALNIARSGSAALVSSSGPYNFFIGNVHDAAGDSRGSRAYYAEVKASGPPAQVPLYRLALVDIASHPFAWLALLTRKIGLLLSAREIPDNLSYAMGRKLNPRLALAAAEPWLLLPAALAGLALGLRQRRRLSLLYMFVATYTASVVGFFVVSRFQLPLVPALALFVALGLDRWWTAVGRRRFVPAAAAAAVVAVAAAWLRPAPGGYRAIDLDMAAAAYFSRGMDEEAAQRRDAARRFYARAVALNPAHGHALERIVALGGPPWTGPPAPEALALCERARRASAAGNQDEARRLLAEAERIEPGWSLPQQYLANVDFLSGHRRGAILHLERAVERAPLDAALRANLRALRVSATPPTSEAAPVDDR